MQEYGGGREMNEESYEMECNLMLRLRIRVVPNLVLMDSFEV